MFRYMTLDECRTRFPSFDQHLARQPDLERKYRNELAQYPVAATLRAWAVYDHHWGMPPIAQVEIVCPFRCVNGRHVHSIPFDGQSSLSVRMPHCDPAARAVPRYVLPPVPQEAIAGVIDTLPWT